MSRGIIMSADSVRAIMDNRKTQTRRVIKLQPEDGAFGNVWWKGDWDTRGGPRAGVHTHVTLGMGGPTWTLEEIAEHSPHGKPGDVLYVREGYFETSWQDVIYRADSNEDVEEFRKEGGWAWKSPMCMPESYSRLHIRLTDVRVERLQAITADDALAEGIHKVTKDGDVFKYCVFDRRDYSSTTWQDMPRNAIQAFSQVWDSINAGKGFSWESNPWVWVLCFERVEVMRDE